MDAKNLSPAQRHGLELLLDNVFRYVDFKTNDDGHTTTLTVEWNGPPLIRLAVQDDAPVKVIERKDPPSVSLDQWVQSALPGLYGYMPERDRANRICAWCGKVKNETCREKIPT